jgi:purine-binding chemotaxis protein CheW
MDGERIKRPSQYLTFRLDKELFALDVYQVREVLDLCTITRVPQALDFIRGMINVRGSVVPVVDLRVKFGLSATENGIDTRIIVMELSLDGHTNVLGAMADSVHEVIELPPESIEGAPRIGSRWRSEFIRGIGKRGEEFIIILDIDRIFSSEELAVVESLPPGEEEG